ncbi:hypothetical protein ASPFODRAFT_714078 [Aspergillus luchuensis CBS 106.47]|uniref:Uncharacterized protein n=1 Tax=Aspergillus luchuensis (strain CBS 106.47) TaxID=1137211 RepID=A0A1M3SYT1_ASPLC|nr:hypothetical protein ASPFODRAFT_714078 [Aspergillus luchuensis CBS 106.47]
MPLTLRFTEHGHRTVVSPAPQYVAHKSAVSPTVVRLMPQNGPARVEYPDAEIGTVHWGTTFKPGKWENAGQTEQNNDSLGNNVNIEFDYTARTSELPAMRITAAMSYCVCDGKNLANLTDTVVYGESRAKNGQITLAVKTSEIVLWECGYAIPL